MRSRQRNVAVASELGNAMPRCHVVRGGATPDTDRQKTDQAMMFTPPSTYTVPPESRRAYGVAR